MTQSAQEAAAPKERLDEAIIALSPVGTPPAVTTKRMAARMEQLEGRIVYLVDCRFDDSVELLEQVERWFAEHVPGLEVKLVQLSSVYKRDDPETWAKIEADRAGAILGVGHCSTCAPAVATHGVTLEHRYGVPTVTLHTATFERVVRSVTRMAGMPDLACVYVPQPVMGRSASELQAYVEGLDPVTGRPVMWEVMQGLTAGLSPQERPLRRAPVTGEGTRERSAHTVTARDEEHARAVFEQNGWTDHLPIVVPTRARVEAMLAGTSHPDDEVVGHMQPTANRGAWEYTVRDVAVNAVMAGARPEYLPVILALAASEVSARPSSSSSAAVMVVANGPIRNEIGMGSGVGALGPYSHANATIGRAYGLLSQNVQGGSVPGESYMGSQGNGHGYNSLTFAENEERSQWEPLHVTKGFAREQSTVSIFTGCRSTTFGLGLRERYWREHVRDMLLGVDAVTAPALLLDPITARQFVERGGFVEKAELIRFVHETARMPAGRYWDLQLIQNYVYPRATFGEEPLASLLEADADEEISIFPEEAINVVVVGGETNGYWQIVGCRYERTMPVDQWR